jgi:hypothetical protein
MPTVVELFVEQKNIDTDKWLPLAELPNVRFSPVLPAPDPVPSVFVSFQSGVPALLAILCGECNSFILDEERFSPIDSNRGMPPGLSETIQNILQPEEGPVRYRSVTHYYLDELKEFPWSKKHVVYSVQMLERDYKSYVSTGTPENYFRGFCGDGYVHVSDNVYDQMEEGEVAKPKGKKIIVNTTWEWDYAEASGTRFQEYLDELKSYAKKDKKIRVICAVRETDLVLE